MLKLHKCSYYINDNIAGVARAFEPAPPPLRGRGVRAGGQAARQ